MNSSQKIAKAAAVRKTIFCKHARLTSGSVKGAKGLILCGLSVLLLNLFSASAFAASGTWLATPHDSFWLPASGGTNWTSGIGQYPGALGTTNNGDTATFAASSNFTSITINAATLNVKSITFTGTNAVAFTIGSTSGSSLFLTNGGAISIASVLTGANNTDTVNAPLVLEPASATTAGSYTFSNASGTASHPLVIGGRVSGATTTQGITLTLTGSNTGSNTVSGNISDGGAAGGLAISKTSTGTWILTGSNSFSGSTSVSAGTLNINGGSNQALGGTGSVSVTGTGTLLLSSSNQIKDTAGVTLGGGTLQLNNVSEGTTSAAGVGALTLSSSSTIDLTGTDILHFAVSDTQAWTGTLSIVNWSGTPITGGGAEELLFGTNATSITAAQLLEIQFIDPAGYAPGTYTATFATLNPGEIVPLAPVPEPSTDVAAVLAVAALLVTQRRHFKGSRKLA